MLQRRADEQTPHDQILAALRYLAKQDPDQARDVNGIGFNKPDSYLGHALASQDKLTNGQAIRAYRMLCKYRRQLEGVGLSLPSWPPLVDVDEAMDIERKPVGNVTWEEPEETVDQEEAPVSPPIPCMREVLGPGGIIAQTLPGYEAREPQIQMAELVAEAIQSREHAIVEAGTGVGKSLAYLIPAIYSGRKTVVSTADKGLQEQLWRMDVPFLQDCLPVPFTAAILKGRANYVCLERWNEEIGEQEMFGPSWEYGRVKEWLKTTESGDLEELPFALSTEFHSHITSTADQCLGQHCPSFYSCFAEKAKSSAQRADIVVVNHTLLALDCAIRAQSDGYATVIPDRDLVIIDEAHRLEDAATLAFQTEISAIGISRLLHDKQIKEAQLNLELSKIEDSSQRFFDLLARLGNSQAYAINEPPQTIKLVADNLAAQLHGLARDIEHQNPYIDRDLEPGEQQDADAESLKKLVKRIDNYADTIEDILHPHPSKIIYVEKRPGKTSHFIYLRKCPISVAEDLHVALFDKWPTICTSATLATGGTFDFFKARCGCEEARTLIVDSPFDYTRSMLIYMPPAGSMLDPTKYYQEGSEDYLNRVAAQIEQLLLASDGRAFCLFTSNRALNAVYDRLAHRLRWLVLKQGDAPRPELLKQFKEDGKAVLFGLRSFWEGIDVRGQALSLVIIDKLPFGQPDDPIYDARCKEIVKRTGDQWAWFRELALPTAILTLKQGVGRLIRTQSDWGVVALLDERITTKAYGGTILSSLPMGARTRSIEAVKMFFATRNITDPQQHRLI